MRSCGGPPGKHVTGWRECEVQQSFVSSSVASLSWRSTCAWGISTDSSKTSNRCNWRKQKMWNHSASVTRNGYCCAKRGVSARGGWNSSARCWTLNLTCSTPTSRRGYRSTQSRVPSGLSSRRGRLPQRWRQWQTRKRWDRMAFPRNCRTILLELHRLTVLIWRQGKVPQQ